MIKTVWPTAEPGPPQTAPQRSKIFDQLIVFAFHRESGPFCEPTQISIRKACVVQWTSRMDRFHDSRFVTKKACTKNLVLWDSYLPCETVFVLCVCVCVRERTRVGRHTLQSKHNEPEPDLPTHPPTLHSSGVRTDYGHLVTKVVVMVLGM